MSNDPIAAVVLWFCALLVMAAVLPVVAAGCVVLMVGRAVIWLARSGRQLVQGRPSLQRELQRVSRERSEAIRDILAIRRQAELQMLAAADDKVIEGTAEEWRE